MFDEEYDFAIMRSTMVMAQLKERGISDTAVLRAMNTVPREAFVTEPYKEYAYQDGPLPLPAHQTISQPYIVALMASLLDLKPSDRVLEIGAGSGYAAAVLSRIVDKVYAVERHKELVDYARRCLDGLGYDNVCLHHGDGTLGWPEHAPYDAIAVAAGGPSIPLTLRDQLTVGGRLVMPIGHEERKQRLICVYRLSRDKFSEKNHGAVAFVPLIGAEGWPGAKAKKSKRRR
ncbi:MAG: protein-L-isoaspartate(D-aspartate) O-methyltransferase [Chloroflexi bacterium]|nr:protein-L-isoaspartate(D-aspartate) O-methyltransferase [Chloroflexota bacterium]